MYNGLYFTFEMIYQFVFTLIVDPPMHLLIAFAGQKYFYWHGVGWYICLPGDVPMFVVLVLHSHHRLKPLSRVRIALSTRLHMLTVVSGNIYPQMNLRSNFGVISLLLASSNYFFPICVTKGILHNFHVFLRR